MTGLKELRQGIWLWQPSALALYLHESYGVYLKLLMYI